MHIRTIQTIESDAGNFTIEEGYLSDAVRRPCHGMGARTVTL